MATMGNTVKLGSQEASLPGQVSVRNMSDLQSSQLSFDPGPKTLASLTLPWLSVSAPCAAMALLLTFLMVVIVGALVLVGFLHYRKTGSLLPTLPKLPRSVSVC